MSSRPLGIGSAALGALLAGLLTGCAPSPANHSDQSPSPAAPASPTAPVRYAIPDDLCDRLDHAPLSGLLDFANATVKVDSVPAKPGQDGLACRIGAGPASRDRFISLQIMVRVTEPVADATVSRPPSPAKGQLPGQSRVEGLGDEAWLRYTAVPDAVDNPFGDGTSRVTNAILAVEEDRARLGLNMSVGHPENPSRDTVEECLTGYARQVLELMRAG